MKHFIFDVDGTLTPSRGKIDKEFKTFFKNFCTNNNVYLVTGSDKPKTVEQIGEDIYNLCARVYNCSGNDVWQGTDNIYTNDWKIPHEAEGWLREEMAISKFPLRTGLHLEDRPGMCNFSVVGRNATLGERKLYVEHDTKTEERVTIARLFKLKFPDIEAVVGGETGIDIFPVGADKGQLTKDFDLENDEIHFFGDRMDPDGNDYPLAQKLIDYENCYCYNVDTWETTYKTLQTL